MNKNLLCPPQQTQAEEEDLEKQILLTPPRIPVTISAPANENVPHHTTEDS